MTPLVARILLSVVMFPFFICAGLLFGIVLERVVRVGGNSTAAISAVLAYTGAATFWLLLWRGVIVWTATRLARTAMAAVCCTLFTITVGILVATITYAWELIVIFACILGLMVWMGSTVTIWRETTEEFNARIRGAAGGRLLCPTCGYNMVGLYESRCPECGTRYTLDQLLASQDAESSDLSSDTS